MMPQPPMGPEMMPQELTPEMFAQMTAAGGAPPQPMPGPDDIPPELLAQMMGPGAGPPMQ